MDRKTYEDQQQERQIVALERIAKGLEVMCAKLTPVLDAARFARAGEGD